MTGSRQNISQLIAQQRLYDRHGAVGDSSLGKDANNLKKQIEDKTKVVVGFITEVGAALLLNEGLTMLETQLNSVITSMGKLTTLTETFVSTLSLSSKASSELMLNLSKVAAMPDSDLPVTAQELAKGIQSVESILPGVGRGFQYVENTLNNASKFAGIMQTHFRMSAEESAKLTRFVLSTGQETEQVVSQFASIAKQIENITGETDVFARTMKVIAGTTPLVRGYLSDNVGELQKAAYFADKYKISIDDSFAAGMRSLNVQESIAAEMQLQAITGEEILTRNGENLMQELRIATAKGDVTRIQELQKQFIEEQQDLLKDPLFAQLASDVIGLTSQQVAEFREQINAINQSSEQINKFSRAIEGAATNTKEQLKASADVAGTLSQINLDQPLEGMTTEKALFEQRAITTTEQAQRTIDALYTGIIPQLNTATTSLNALVTNTQPISQQFSGLMSEFATALTGAVTSGFRGLGINVNVDVKSPTAGTTATSTVNQISNK